MALERALSVDALAKVLTGIGTNRTFVHILVTGPSYETSRAGADSTTIQGVGITHGSLVTRVAHTCIVQVAQETSLAHWALAEEGRYPVMAGGTIKADGCGAVVDVLAAVVSSPAIDADTSVTTDGVEAGAAIMASIGLH